MLANTLNICSDEELEHDGAQIEDGKFDFDDRNLHCVFFCFFF
jgi:hypothetical protein